MTEHVFSVDAGALNVFLIVTEDGATLVDAGFPGTMAAVDDALLSLGRGLVDLSNVLVTHCHPDHAAGLAEIERETGAQSWMHPADAGLVRTGGAMRPFETTPGFRNRAIVHLPFWRARQTNEPAVVHHEVLPGETIPVAGGIEAIGTPGHTLGHLAFLWPRDGGVLFVGDAAKNARGLAPSPVYEDYAQGLEDLGTLAALEFETACFAHGAPIVGGAAGEFRRTWGRGGQA